MIGPESAIALAVERKKKVHTVPESKRLYLYGGAYANTDDARADLGHLRELHGGKHIGRYDAVAISKKPDGSVAVIDLDTTVRGTGAWKGALAGGALMVLFPPSVLRRRRGRRGSRGDRE